MKIRILQIIFLQTRTDYACMTSWTRFATGKNFSFNQCHTKSFAFFSRESYFIKAIEKLFSSVCIAWYKHSRRWENSQQLCKPSTSSRVCITVSNSPNASRVSIRLCKHGKRFLLLKYCWIYWQNSRQLCKPETNLRVCITVESSPYASSVYIRLCKHRKEFSIAFIK